MMLKCRMLGEKLNARSRAVSNGGHRPIAGREAVLVGAAAHALPEDRVITGSACPAQVINQLFSAGHLHAADTLDHSALEHGLAVARELDGQRKAAIVFCSPDMATDTIHHALRRAARERLPLVCIAESSYAVIDREQACQRDQRAIPPDMNSFFPRIAVDGNDVVAMFRVAQEAVRRARAGHGPSLIQCVMQAAGDKKNDPLVFMERYLKRRKMWSDELQKH